MSARRGPGREGATTRTDPSGIEAPILLSSLPSEVPFGVVGRILPSGSRAEWRMHLHPIARPQALELLGRARSVASVELAAPDDGGPGSTSALEVERASATALGDRVAAREQGLYRVGWVLTARAATRAAAERLRSTVARRAAALGFGVRPPRFETTPALAGPALAGPEDRPAGFWHTLHTDGVAAFFPFIEEAVAEPGGILVGLSLDDAAPVFLNRFARASHSSAIFGATGSGKSFLAAVTMLRSRWRYPDLDLVVLDPLGEFGPFVRAIGGDVVALGSPDGGRLNPLDPATTLGDRTEKAARAALELRTLFPSLNDEEMGALDRALARAYAELAEPTFADLQDRVARDARPGALPGLLELVVSGSLRGLNGPTTVRWSEGPVAIDLRHVADGHRPYHLAFLLDAVAGRLARRPGPKLVLVDEAHLLARDPAALSLLDRLVRHVRHFAGGLVLASQDPDDFATTDPGRALLRNLGDVTLLRLPHVSDAARAIFRLTDAEAEWVPRARVARDVGYSEGLLRVGPAHLPLAFVASTPEVELLEGTLVRPTGPA
ncbi:MAG TPA: DUF87 domain-containing protein [Thermoplasmata archaeon]|nr:DUF87 domain-containing protein [Thermoplasmata archaeon]